MPNVVAPDRVLDAGGALLVGEFRRVNANHDDLVGKLFFDAPQGGDYLDAVDASFSPEIENYNAAVQACYRQRCRDVEPFEPRECNFRCFHFRITGLCVEPNNE